MSEVKNPNPSLLGELQSTPPVKPKRTITVPPMPKAVAERLKKLTTESTLSKDGEAILGEPQAVADEVNEVYPDIPQQDRTAFLAHLLGAPHFKKSYELFGGALNVTFRTRSGPEEEACARAATKAVPEPGIPDKITPEVRIAVAQAGAARLRCYRELTMIVSLCDIQRDGRAPVLSLIEGDIKNVDIDALRLEFIATTPGTLLGTIRLYHDRFEALTSTMISLADKPGFWGAVSAT